MNKRKLALCSLLLMTVLCAALILPGCSIISKTLGVKIVEPTLVAPTNSITAVPVATASVKTATIGSDTSTVALEATATPAQGKAAVALKEFIAAFTTLDKNPLDVNLQYAMYLEAIATDNPSQTSGTTSQSLLGPMVEKYNALVNDKGLHYTDSMSAMGLELTAAHWVKAGKFKKVDSLNNVTMFDGTDYYEYNIDSKKGKKLPKEDPAAASALKVEVEGMLSILAASPLEQKKDAKVGKFNCYVFYMDVEIIGIMGNTIYVDKNTGMLVKNAYGDPKDKKKSMVTTVLTMDTTGFSDDVFAVPGDVAFE